MVTVPVCLKIFVILILLLVQLLQGVNFAVASGSSSDGTELQCHHWENVTYEECRPITGNITFLPNFFGHMTQWEAAAALNDFHPFLVTECSSQLKMFLCHLYFPRCVSHVLTPLLPCRESCQHVRKKCDAAFQSAGAAWPEFLDCESRFSVHSLSNLCFTIVEFESHEENEDPTSSSAATMTTIPPSTRSDPSERCQPIHRDPICKTLPYSTVIYPNLVGHRNQSEALLDLHKYSVFMSMQNQCTDTLRLFLCIAYQSPCKILDDVSVPMPPCQDLCQLALSESCLAVMKSFHTELPAALRDCSRYPKQSSTDLNCVMPGVEPLANWHPVPFVHPYTHQRCNFTGCVPVPHAKCRALGFTTATFPNLLGHQTVEEALANLDTLSQVFDSGCAEDLQPFLCSAHFVDESSRVLNYPPCQVMCQKVWRSCRHTIGSLLDKTRPRVMTCRIYNVDKDCYSDFRKPKEPPVILTSQRVNFTHGLIEYKSPTPSAWMIYISRWHSRTDYITHNPGEDRYQVYLDLDYSEGVYAILSSVYFGFHLTPASVVWIPDAEESLPRNCERTKVTPCIALGYNTSPNNSHITWRWEPPEQLWTNWQTYFPQNTVNTDSGCLAHLLDLVCGLLFPKCTSWEYDALGPCMGFCIRVYNECSSTAELSWLLDSLPCDYLVEEGQGRCLTGEDQTKPDIKLEVEHHGLSVELTCLLLGETKGNSSLEILDRYGEFIPNVVRADKLVYLYIDELGLETSGTYTCRLSDGTVEKTVDIHPRGTCLPAHNHSICTAISQTGHVLIPNVLGHTSQYNAELAAYEFLPLLYTNCSPHLLQFVCALYMPECTAVDTHEAEQYFIHHEQNPPSRELCQNVKSDCAEAMTQIGFKWPWAVRCNVLPSKPENGATISHAGPKKKGCINLRRYDITDRGMECLFHGWADVQGLGAANDYCRIVSTGHYKMLSCALAGTHGESQYNYNSSNPHVWLDLGHTDTWYMRDKDGDGRDDYCRCVGAPPYTHMSCLRAGKEGFETEFTPDNIASEDCQYHKANQVFGP